MPRGRSRTRISRPSRKFIWARTFIADTGGLTNPFFIDALADVQTAIGADLIGSTLVRVRGDILAINTDAATGTSAVLGMRVFTTSTLPQLLPAQGPVSDEYADWLMFEPFSFTASGNQDFSAQRKTIDNQSSRKLEEVGQSLLLSFQGSAIADVQVIGWLSLGVKLP